MKIFKLRAENFGKHASAWPAFVHANTTEIRKFSHPCLETQQFNIIDELNIINPVYY